jgi:CheY-like chemotaxis protein
MVSREGFSESIEDRSGWNTAREKWNTTRAISRKWAHSMSQTLVLSVGSNRAILDTRDLLLRSVGYHIVSVMSVREAVSVFQDDDFDLIVLCHTLPQKDCERLTCFIRASGSRIPIATVSNTLGESNPFADMALEREPVAFLAGIRDLLNRHAKVHQASQSAFDRIVGAAQ